MDRAPTDTGSTAGAGATRAQNATATADSSNPSYSESRFAPAQAVADAVLYEGYLLYPYRKSSTKNATSRARWQFGVLVPRQWLAASGGGAGETVAGSAESWFQQTECLLEAGANDTSVVVRLRFLQLQAKTVEGRGPSPEGLSHDEAVPHEVDVAASLTDLLDEPLVHPVLVPDGRDVSDDGGTVRQRWSIAARVVLRAWREDVPFRLYRLQVRVENADEELPPDAPREQALRVALLATHTVLAVDGGAFLSLLDPPEWAAAAARGCHNLHTYPVLVGEAGSRQLMLSSPIILYDHPRVAPESPQDLFDATEIDEILSLRTMTLTDAEKAEARATDPRAAALLDRVDTMPPELLTRLHGAVRSLRPIEAASGSVVVDGVRVERGARVRLRPRVRGSDAADMFLAGRTGRVAAVLDDLDGGQQLAITVDDDPAAELHEWYGRYHYFRPTEVEPLP